MKKFYLVLFAVVGALFYTGCSNDDNDVASSLEILTSDVGFESVGGSGTITLRTNEASVSVTSNQDWLTVTSANNEQVAYTVDEYEGALYRSASLTLVAGTASCEVTITQKGSSFFVDGDEVTVDPSGREATEVAYDATQSGAPVVTIPADASWLHATVDTEKRVVALTGDINFESPRTTTVIITAGWKPVEVVVSQETVALFDQTEVSFDSDAQTTEVVPTEFLAMVTTDWTVSSTVDWVTVSKSDAGFTVGVSENTTGVARSGEVQVKSGNTVLATFSVKQKWFSYAYFLGTWTMNYDSSSTLSVTFREGEKGKTILMDGWKFSGIELGYSESDDTATLSLTTFEWGTYGSYNIIIAPLYNNNSNITWAEGVGYNLVLTADGVLTAEDNGVLGSSTVSGFQCAAFSNGSYAGGFASYKNITTFTR